MKPILLMLIPFLGYLLMYRFYGRFISTKLFQLKKDNPVPSIDLNDGIDYTPTKKQILFGHHFASIAGTGPIVGPAIAVIWGWLPAMLWVFFGSILIGGLHDMGALVISMRNQGKSLADFSGKYINKYTRYSIFVIAFLLLWIFISILGMIIAIIFNMFPGAVLPIWLQIPIAIWIGYQINSKGQSSIKWSIIGVVLMYITILIGVYFPIKMPVIAGISSTGSWTAILLVYAFIASVLPVKKLMQPRDYINAHQLFVTIALLFLGIISSAIFLPQFDIVAPAVVHHPTGAPSMMPFIFIIIACGAVSGFHSLVSSGTSSKQISSENDALYIGYGGMLTESLLSVFVIIATVAGIGIAYSAKDGQILTGLAAWNEHYASWEAAKGLGSKIQAFVIGSANMISSIGIPHNIATIIMGVFVASFAGTSLDTSTRLQRYFISEMIPVKANPKLKNRYLHTAIVVVLAAILAYSTGSDGKGALKLWPLFGAVNQILAALALIVLTMYLRSKQNRYWLVAGIPALFMCIMTLWATVNNLYEFENQHNTILIVINLIIMVLTVIVLFSGIIKLRKPTKEQIHTN